MPSISSRNQEATTITDPVTGFEYPGKWVIACQDPGMRALAASGLGVLTSNGRVMRRGFTTGTTAAAACSAAVLSLHKPVREVKVHIPCGIVVPVRATGRKGHGAAEKFAGDYPGDATAGLWFHADASAAEDGVVLVAGAGIGRFSRDTSRNKTGEPAISKAALQCILDAIEGALIQTGLSGVKVTLTVPDGEAAAAHTLNPKIGILGGISVLGTTGLVEPWDDHFTESMLERVTRADRVVITTGRLGLRYSRLLFPDYEVVLAGAKIREVLEHTPGEVILCGLPGLVLKFLDPNILEGTPCPTVEELSCRPGFDRILSGLFEKGKVKYPNLRVIVLSREGVVLGDSK